MLHHMISKNLRVCKFSCKIHTNVWVSKFRSSTVVYYNTVLLRNLLTQTLISNLKTPKTKSHKITKAFGVDTVQDLLIKLGIKPHLHILKISIFSLNHLIVRPTKVMNNLLKVCKICTSKGIFRHQKSTKPFRFFFFFCKEFLTRRSTFINEIF